MNLDHYNDPRQFVRDTLDEIYDQLGDMPNLSSEIVEKVRLERIDATHAVYDVAAVRGDISKDAWQLLLLGAACRAYLGPEELRDVARLEFERRYETWERKLLNAVEHSVRQSERGSIRSGKTLARNQTIVETANRLVVSDSKSYRNVAGILSKDFGISARRIRDILNEEGWYDQFRGKKK